MSTPFELKLTDVGEGIVEAEVTDLFVTIGSLVEEDQPLLEIMTEKVTLEIPSPISGQISELFVNTGDIVPVGSMLMSITDSEHKGKHGNNQEGFRSNLDTSNSTNKPSNEISENESTKEKQIIAEGPSNQPLAAPATRRRAKELGVKLEEVKGSGPAGRISITDVEDYFSNHSAKSPSSDSDQDIGEITEIKLSGLRRKIAAQVQNAKVKIPHFSYSEECDVTKLELMRSDANRNRSEAQPKLTLLPFFMRALASLYLKYPMINARYDDEKEILHSFNRLHIGIATSTSLGLLVPVVRNVQSLDIWECARELKEVADATKANKAHPNQMKGSSITISSLGALGGITSTPIINHPEVAIISPNKVRESPVVLAGEITIRKLMNVSASFDHRIVDGHEAARFIQDFKNLLENPIELGK
jgi:2-oxoisovalerate dehydrogenase E2 component (dihydrolipoyl transacylase)